MSVVNAIPLIAAGDDGYNLTRSLRFRSSASAYLNRTPATASNRKTFTWSGWVKRGTLSTYQHLFSATTGGYPFIVRFDTDNTIFVYQDGTSDYGGSTSAVYRDPSAWYHIVLAMDTTQATDTNRLKLYVNGVQNSVSAFYGYFALNVDTSINSTGVHAIGQSGSANYFDGYMAEVNFIDGQALTPSSFGSFSSYNQWLPKKYAGTYGTNGFYLPFTNNASAATLGNDFSGNGNTWTTNNISVTAGATYDSMTDVPTLTSATAANYCVLNPLSTTTALTDGNLKIASVSGTIITTQLVTSDKWYWELTLDGGSSYNYFFGVQSPNQVDYVYMGMCNGGNSPNIFAVGKSTNGTATQPTGSRPTQPATIGVKLDITAGSVEFLVNGTVNGSVTGITNWPTGQYWMPFFSNWTATFGYVPLTANFGQQPFVNSLPTGFLALNTFNL